MKTKRFSSPPRKPVPCCLAFGKFDGFHKGHQAIINTLREMSESQKTIPAVFTFRTFPVPFYLSSWKERRCFLQDAGVSLCIWDDFEIIRNIQAEPFLHQLSHFCDIRGIVVGKDFKFGKDRKGSAASLGRWTKKQGGQIILLDPVREKKGIISSSAIRTMVEQGDFFQAAQFLGRWLSFEGLVVHGEGIGRKIGFPTANISLKHSLPIPQGIYAGITVLPSGRSEKALAFVGPAPTFQRKQSLFELHIPQFQGDLYGSSLHFYPLLFLRKTRSFSSLEKLRHAIAKDVEKALTLLHSNHLTDYS
ncbi:MAG: riboflavin biosynthesis protein RibF [Candidatus Ratteibacteria bacterium]|jgi:riboflavin kinase/FMN adenylyltransferase